MPSLSDNLLPFFRRRLLRIPLETARAGGDVRCLPDRTSPAVGPQMLKLRRKHPSRRLGRKGFQTVAIGFRLAFGTAIRALTYEENKQSNSE